MMDQFRVKGQDKVNALKYYEKISKNYDTFTSWGFQKYLRKRERSSVLRLLQLNDQVQSFADIGCGAGVYALEGKRHGYRVFAADASPTMVERIKDKVDEARVIDIENFTPEQPFDRVVCAGVLDFVLNPQKAFENLCRSVAPGGRLVVLVPSEGFASWIYRFEKRVLGFSVNIYSKKWFIEQSLRHGLALVESEQPLPINRVFAFIRPRSL